MFFALHVTAIKFINPLCRVIHHGYVSCWSSSIHKRYLFHGLFWALRVEYRVSSSCHTCGWLPVHNPILVPVYSETCLFRLARSTHHTDICGRPTVHREISAAAGELRARLREVWRQTGGRLWQWWWGCRRREGFRKAIIRTPNDWQFGTQGWTIVWWLTIWLHARLKEKVGGGGVRGGRRLRSWEKCSNCVQLGFQGYEMWAARELLGVWLLCGKSMEKMIWVTKTMLPTQFEIWSSLMTWLRVKPDDLAEGHQAWWLGWGLSSLMTWVKLGDLAVVHTWWPG